MAYIPRMLLFWQQKQITVEAVNEDDEQGEIDNLDGRTSSGEQSGENQPHVSETADQSLQTTAEFGKAQVSCEPDLGESSSAVAPGYVPSVLDERIVLELPSLMVLPLRGHTRNFPVDGSDCTEVRDEEKDRSWTMSSLHQLYSRRSP